jgi:hypothetical protein
VLVGCDNLWESAEVVIGSACEQVAGAVTEAEVGRTESVAATMDREERASSGTVAVSRTSSPIGGRPP